MTVTFTFRPSKGVPSAALHLLQSHLPYSLVLLRRLQFTSFPGGTTPEGRVTIVAEDGAPLESWNSDNPIDATSIRSFTMAYYDFLAGPDTQMYMYSTFQDTPDDASKKALCEEQLRALLDVMVSHRKEYGKPLIYESSLLLGSVHSEVRKLLESLGRVQPRKTGDYDKWLFKVDEMPGAGGELPEGMRWDDGNLEDCKLVASRTNIPRTAENLLRWPNLFIKHGDRPIAWAFLGQDASLSSLQVEEEYRRRGLARLLTVKLFQEKTLLYGNDGWASSDVAADNEASRSVSRALGGKESWVVSWVLLNVTDETVSPE